MKVAIALDELKQIRNNLKKENKKVVFTNGVFDLIHAGHVDYLIKAKSLGDILIIGLNSDESVKIIKGNKRPILNQEERAYVLSQLKPVDFVTVFDEDTPEKLIDELIPDVLVKGGDWQIENIIGREIVLNSGGKVESIDIVNQQSTSKIIELILERFSR